MANLHILQRSGAEVQVIAHVAIPNSNNAVGVNWRTAIINSGVGGRTSLPDGDGTAGTISAAEKAQIASGAIYEVDATIRPQGVANGAPLNAFLDTEFARITAEVQAEFQARLNYYGATR